VVGTDLLLALVRAHYRRENEQFRTLVHQAASRLKNESAKRELLRLAESVLTMLPTDTKNMVVELPRVELADLVLETPLRATLDEIALELRHGSAMRARLVRPRCRLLFAGPPGNGKTSAAAALATSVGQQAYGVNLSGLVESFMGATGANLTRLFQVLQAGCLVVVDEVDAIGMSRGGVTSVDKESNRIVNTLLTLLDRVDQGTLVATTNRIDLLDPALLRRFDAVLVFEPPSVGKAHELAERLATRYGISDIGLDPSTVYPNFSAVAQAVLAVARREVLADILSQQGEPHAVRESEEEDAAGSPGDNGAVGRIARATGGE